MTTLDQYIQLDDVTKTFIRKRHSALRVLQGLSLNVAEGSLVSILGPSGCGKSTLLNLLNGLDDVTSGEIRVKGHLVTKQSRSDVRVGVVFQSPRLLSWMTVADNVRLPLTTNGVPKHEAKERVEKYLDLVGLADFAGYFPMQLSGGMQQRVALARGLALEPDLLLADEPFSALDEFTADRLRTEFVDMWRATGRTIIFVTHNIRESVFLSSRIIIVTARPSRVYLDIPVDLPYPRDQRDPALFEVEREVSLQFRKMHQR